ncbi:MAG: ribonuclease III [Holosporales bacterium]|jgi:ribonuclease-3|nr:ribonuclease III [Holosporales bacterium]
MSLLFDFQELLGYQFDDEEILELALVHSSVSSKSEEEQKCRAFDRLEFLGDRVLNLIVAELLYKKFKKESEGALSHRYTSLVCFETCAAVAEKICLKEFLNTASKTNLDEMRILCDALEAILGAMYLDGGISPCKKFVKKHWNPYIEKEALPPNDPKSELQEIVQSRWKTLPIYEVVAKAGLDHMPIYKVSVEVDGIGKVIGSGNSKKEAEKEAAQKLLGKLKIRG